MDILYSDKPGKTLKIKAQHPIASLIFRSNFPTLCLGIFAPFLTGPADPGRRCRQPTRAAPDGVTSCMIVANHVGGRWHSQPLMQRLVSQRCVGTLKLSIISAITVKKSRRIRYATAGRPNSSPGRTSKLRDGRGWAFLKP